MSMYKKISNNKYFIIALVSFAGLVGLIVFSLLNLKFIFLGTIDYIFHSISTKDLSYGNGPIPKGGFELASIFIISMIFSIFMGVIFQSLIIFNKKNNQLKNKFIKLSFILTLLFQVCSVFASYFVLIHNQISIIKTIKYVLIMFIAFLPLYIPALVVLCVCCLINAIIQIKELDNAN